MSTGRFASSQRKKSNTGLDSRQQQQQQQHEVEEEEEEVVEEEVEEEEGEEGVASKQHAEASEEPDNRFRSVQHARNINGTETVGRVTVGQSVYINTCNFGSDSISSGAVAVYDAVRRVAAASPRCCRCCLYSHELCAMFYTAHKFPSGVEVVQEADDRAVGEAEEEMEEVGRRFPGTRRLYSLPGWIQRLGLELIGPASS